MGKNYVRGIRGAITVPENTSVAIHQAAKELLVRMAEENQLQPDDIASVFFTVTPDLNADFPAYAARELGWTKVPLMCMTEIAVPGSLPRCLRILIQVNTEKTQEQIKHVYLREATSLRSDLFPAVDKS